MALIKLALTLGILILAMSQAADYTAKGEAILDSYDGSDKTVLARASRLFDLALESDGRLARAYVGLSKASMYGAYIEGGRFDPKGLNMAMDLAEKAVGIAPNSGAAHVQKGYVLLYLGSPTLAKADADKAARLGCRASMLYGEIAMKNGDLDEAERSFNRALTEAGDRHGDRADACDALGETALARGDYPAALRRFKESLSLRPDSCREASNYGFTLVQLGRLDEAIEVLSYALKRQDLPETRSNLAAAYLKKGFLLEECGDAGQARWCYEKALDCDPSDPRAKEMLDKARKRPVAR